MEYFCCSIESNAKLCDKTNFFHMLPGTYTARCSTYFYKKCSFHCAKKKFSIKDFSSKCDQIRSFLRIWSHLLKKSLIENFIFCAVFDIFRNLQISRLTALIICKLESTGNELFYLYKLYTTTKPGLGNKNQIYCVTKIIKNDINYRRYFKYIELSTFKNF